MKTSEMQHLFSAQRQTNAVSSCVLAADCAQQVQPGTDYVRTCRHAGKSCLQAAGTCRHAVDLRLLTDIAEQLAAACI